MAGGAFLDADLEHQWTLDSATHDELAGLPPSSTPRTPARHRCPPGRHYRL